MTLRCKIGDIVFDEAISLSMAKLIRDTVMGQMLNPKKGDLRKLRSEQDVKLFIHDSFPKYEHAVAAVVLV